MFVRRFTVRFCVVLGLAVPLNAQSQFRALSRYAFPTAVEAAAHVAVGDADLDGAPDVFVVRQNVVGGSLGHYRNDGLGGFADVSSTLPSLPAKLWNLAVGDVDGDRAPDLVIVGAAQSQLLLNTGTGGKFRNVTATNLPTHTSTMYGVAMGDVDGDRDVDLVLGSQSGQHELFLNDGTGKFTRAGAARMPQVGLGAWDAKLVDVDGDKDLDLLLGLSSAAQQMLFLNTLGSFADVTAKRMPRMVTSTREVLVGDFDGDGDVDAYYVNYRQRDSLLINDGKGVFKDETSSRLPTLAYGSYGGTVVDVDEDGDLDVVVGHFTNTTTPTETTVLYLNDGKGVFAHAAARMPGRAINALDVAAADFDRDGDMDLAYAAWLKVPSGVYFNHEGQLYAENAPVVGRTWTLDVYAQPGYAKATQNGAVFLGIGPLKPRVATPWGALGITPPFFVGPVFSIAAPGGRVRLSLQVPNDTKLRGVDLWWQALHDHAPVDLRLMNVWTDRIQ